MWLILITKHTLLSAMPKARQDGQDGLFLIEDPCSPPPSSQGMAPQRWLWGHSLTLRRLQGIRSDPSVRREGYDVVICLDGAVDRVDWNPYIHAFLKTTAFFRRRNSGCLKTAPMDRSLLMRPRQEGLCRGCRIILQGAPERCRPACVSRSVTGQACSSHSTTTLSGPVRAHHRPDCLRGHLNFPWVKSSPVIPWLSETRGAWIAGPLRPCRRRVANDVTPRDITDGIGPRPPFLSAPRATS